ncbi:multicomponent Na+:H+ antiporter subunit E [Virgibacillus natechei]|uniref:Multicomponent Na+:H+ antiporter subunit E n=1 Tax=Virgibacillus natechei TaxID=1216297 RepID=A0ABS4IK64_9BACI|nr:Na+/H+ antiporter subunit E [Virgibacillus natechei]MBP1971309.1 multicomponent Na+:H+ antiporter subunit E [Virgibacillus natechei]UZD12956.1 Na+/H+ antiporter subunit E [Virgibacillus natechei]
MAGQFLLNLFISFFWMVVTDELSFSSFMSGYLVGIVVVFILHRFFGRQFYLRRFYSILRLTLIFITELLSSSFYVIKHTLKPKITLKPGIFYYETELEGDWEVPALALLLTLTPGSCVMEVTPEGNAFYIHAMDIEELREKLIQSLTKFEKAIMEVTR